MLTQLVLIVFPLLFVAIVLVPNGVANSAVRPFRRFVTMLAAVQFAVAAGLAIGHLAGAIPVLHWTVLDLRGDAAIAATVHYDAVACLMFTLVSFIGWVICQYSMRYLDGEKTQGRYFRWTSFAIGSVCLMVISGNLMMFMVAWVMTSTALHKLLLHYAHRPAAQRAAWTKFTISRLGDVALIGAIVIVYAHFKTLDLVQIFAAIESQVDSVTPAMNVAAFLLVAGAVTKSAQFPFHTWLPLTMETPTPVSALMHAGIVNAGGYLIIRTSPLVAMTPWALTLLAVIGGFTACFAAVVMTTQTSVKKKLAYSTVAQMGFMLLQCGLGAFSAAMLHIIAHSLYKAYSFLTSGSVMQQRAAMSGALVAKNPPSWLKLIMAFVVVATFLEASFLLLGINPSRQARRATTWRSDLPCTDTLGWAGDANRQPSAAASHDGRGGVTVLCLCRMFLRGRSRDCIQRTLCGCTGTAWSTRCHGARRIPCHVLSANSIVIGEAARMAQYNLHPCLKRLLH